MKLGAHTPHRPHAVCAPSFRVRIALVCNRQPAQSPRGYSEQGGIPARMLNSVHYFPVYIVNYYIRYKVLVNQDKEFSWGLTRDDVNCRTGRQNEQYHSRTAPFRNPQVLTFPTRGGSTFSDKNCARRRQYNSNIQYRGYSSHAGPMQSGSAPRNRSVSVSATRNHT